MVVNSPSTPTTSTSTRALATMDGQDLSSEKPWRVVGLWIATPHGLLMTDSEAMAQAVVQEHAELLAEVAAARRSRRSVLRRRLSQLHAYRVNGRPMVDGDDILALLAEDAASTS